MTVKRSINFNMSERMAPHCWVRPSFENGRTATVHVMSPPSLHAERGALRQWQTSRTSQAVPSKNGARVGEKKRKIGKRVSSVRVIDR